MNAQDHSGITREQLSLGALLITTAIALYISWRVVAPFLPALTWALALAIVAHPVYDKVASRVSKPDLASALAVCLVTLIIIAPIALVTQQIASQLTAQQSGDWEQWKSKILKHPKLAPIVDRIEQHVNIEQELKSTVDSVQKRLSSFARGAVGIAIQLAICLFTLFYFFRDRKRILTAARSYLPLSAPEFDDISA